MGQGEVRSAPPPYSESDTSEESDDDFVDKFVDHFEDDSQDHYKDDSGYDARDELKAEMYSVFTLLNKEGQVKYLKYLTSLRSKSWLMSLRKWV